MRAFILLVAFTAYASADKLPADQPAPLGTAPAPAYASTPVEQPAPITDAHQHYTPAGDNGYYYYYYPVEEPQATKGIASYLPAWSWMTWLTVSLTVVGIILLAPAIVNAMGISAIISALGLPAAARNFDPMSYNYNEVLGFATNVYNAVNKEY